MIGRAAAELRAAAQERDPHTGLTRLEQLDQEIDAGLDTQDTDAEATEDRPLDPDEASRERHLEEWIRTTAAARSGALRHESTPAEAAPSDEARPSENRAAAAVTATRQTTDNNGDGEPPRPLSQSDTEGEPPGPSAPAVTDRPPAPMATLTRAAVGWGLGDRVAATLDRRDPVLGQAFTDLTTVMDSGRLAGTPERQEIICRDHLRKLSGTEPNNALGAAAELHAAATILHTGELAPTGKIAMSAGRREPLDLGTGRRIDVSPVSEADLVFAGRDGRVHLHEVKNTARALANKLRRNTDQLDKMVDWRGRDQDNRRIAVHITTDQGWTGLLGLINASKPGSYAINELIRFDVPLRLGSHDLAPAELARLRDATVACLENRESSDETLREWFARCIPDLDAARDFLRPHGVDFL
ncbi:hypothetical protein [Allonocardiopsis opalescens]|uniref:Uncharacterized protein n=1 Tax=Allonocardiopsis opalescens TaxID=1144618 RepID=A0A2T0Q362_9ACTN|nr:hypothetical protein [Allonocardiopsis opalescens]PRX98108.1 hypothetical protein CLV72_105461 [Allonocardiopsis opalescens]